MFKRFLYVMLLTAAATPASAVVIFDNFTSAQSEASATDFGFSAIFRSDVNQTISQIGARLRINADANVAFHIFSIGAASGPPVADTAPSFTTTSFFGADAGMSYRESAAFSFDLLAGQWYAVGVGADASITFSFDDATVVDPGATFTSLADQNYNILNAFSAPNLFGGSTGCCNIHYQLHGAVTAAPEPGTLFLFAAGLLGFGLARRRQRIS